MTKVRGYALPNGWTIATIPKLIGIDGIFIDGDWIESKDQDPNGEIRIIQLADVGDGVYRNRSNRFMNSVKSLKLNCTYLIPGDLLIARMPDPLGRCCIYPGDSKKSVTVVDVCIVRTGRTGAFTKWLMYAINSPDFRSDIFKEQSGSTRKRISRGNLAKLSLKIPPLPEQYRIVSKIEELFSDLDSGINALKQIQVQLKRYRQAVLKAAFEGKLTEEWRKKQKNLETGEALLKRIRADRKKRVHDEQIETHKNFLKARVSNASVHTAPSDVLKYGLLDLVVHDYDNSNPIEVKNIIELYFAKHPEFASHEELVKGHLNWLGTCVLIFKEYGIVCETIEKQKTVWETYIKQKADKNIRTVTFAFGSVSTQMDGMKAWMEEGEIRSKGTRYIRETYINKFVEKKWKAIEEKLNQSPIDTSELPELPKEWAWARLNDVGELSRGMSKHRPRDAAFLYGGKYPFIQTGDIRNAKGSITTYTQTYSDEGLRQSKLWPIGTLAITIAANIGETAILGIEACFPDSVVGLKTEGNIFDIRYLHFYFKTIKSRLEQLAPATAQKNINVAILNSILVPIPSSIELLEIMSEIERLLSVADAIENTVEESLSQSDRLRQSILKMAFEGKLVPQDPSDEPADKLLERINEERKRNNAEVRGKNDKLQ